MRIDGRKGLDELREVKIIRHFTKNPLGSTLIKVGNTKVLATATCEEGVPSFLKGQGKGWLTAEYDMLPGSPNTRKQRSRFGKIDGRVQEIQRLIGRSLRPCVDFELLGERTIWIDCDVLEADGGTRTASITGAFVSLYDAIESLKKRGSITKNPIKYFVASVSVGIVKGEMLLDLCYEEDSKAQVDMNVVMTEGGKIIELQSTAERNPFPKVKLLKLLTLAKKGIRKLVRIQRNALGFD